MWSEEAGRNQLLWWQTAQVVPCNSKQDTYELMREEEVKALPSKETKKKQKNQKTTTNKTKKQTPCWYHNSTWTGISLFFLSQCTLAALTTPRHNPQELCSQAIAMGPWECCPSTRQWHWMVFLLATDVLFVSTCDKSGWQSSDWWRKLCKIYERATTLLGRKSYFRSARVTAIADNC